MAAPLGIDFGTEFCRLAECPDGARVNRVAAPQLQQYRTPSAVGYRDRWIWGWSALAAPLDAVWDIRRRVCEGTLHLLGGDRCDGAELAFRFLRQLRPSLPEAGGPPPAIALTVPYSMGLRQRERLRQSAENAGFRHMGLINDAEAALLGYRVEERLYEGEATRTLVFNVGACSTDISILEARYSHGRLTAELVAHDNQAPGLRSLQEQILRDLGLRPIEDVPPALQFEGFENAFRQAAAGQDAVFEVNGAPMEIEASAVFDAIQKWTRAAEIALDRALQAAQVEAADIEVALPTGGGCELAQVREVIDHLPGPTQMGTGNDERDAAARQVALSGIEDIGARGAARYAAMLAARDTEPLFRSAEVPAVGFELANGAFHPVLTVNHVPGARGFRVYKPGDDACDVLRLVPRQGFARIALCNPPVMEGGGLEVWLDSNGQLIGVEATREPNGKLKIKVSHGDPNEWTLDLK